MTVIYDVQTTGESCAHYRADGLDAENQGKRLDRYTQCPEPGQSTAIVCGVVGQSQSDTYTHVCGWQNTAAAPSVFMWNEVSDEI